MAFELGRHKCFPLLAVYDKIGDVGRRVKDIYLEILICELIQAGKPAAQIATDCFGITELRH